MKKFLLIQACGHSDEENEARSIEAQAKMYGMETVNKCVRTEEDLVNVLNQNGQFDYIYLSSHGDADGFANQTHELSMSWKQLGELICESECLKEDSIIILSCCRGGLNEVAYSMFYTCDKIEYVVGPRQSLTSLEMVTAYTLFLFCIEMRNIDAVVACSKVLNGCDIRLKCFDRLEVSSDLGFINHKKQWDKEEAKLSRAYKVINDFEEELETYDAEILQSNKTVIKDELDKLEEACSNKDFPYIKVLLQNLNELWECRFSKDNIISEDSL